MTDSHPQLDVIAVGAHPDDVEIACGGTVAHLAKLGYRVGIVDLTDGEPTPGSAGPGQRLAEAEAAAQVLGVTERVTLHLPNRRLFDSFEARITLAREFRKYRPRLVLGQGNRTPMASPDHWQAMQITDAAVFYSRLSKWDSHFEELATHRIPAQLYYHLSLDPMARTDGPTTFVADISDTLETKIEALRCFKSQMPPERDWVFDRIRGAAMQCGTAAGFEAGELFTCPRALGVTDIVELMAPGTR